MLPWPTHLCLEAATRANVQNGGVRHLRALEQVAERYASVQSADVVDAELVAAEGAEGDWGGVVGAGVEEVGELGGGEGGLLEREAGDRWRGLGGHCDHDEKVGRHGW